MPFTKKGLFSAVRVIIVDDHTLVRAGLSRLLQTFSGIDVVGEASNAQQALDMTSLHRPDLVLMDLSLPGRSGLDAMTDVLRAAPRTHVVMMSISTTLGRSDSERSIASSPLAALPTILNHSTLKK